ncbi:uncharacterized histidine-rich protein DDB_G0274557-like [Trichoplusia ni]|uniref:Uncharacterized histidine-rich protein DDB_G0274557-like n=1 Tax=Trichoplusia ni TaxID=7111 RepID=A0A7E5WG95_TRINI|nr:uncharacterized histidine-rich protein DDB_G0274557-like [Trichoplusia ni]
MAAVSAEHAYSSQYIHKHDGHHTPVHVHDKHHHHHHVDYYAPAKYEFEYKVDDPHTGDHKSHHEERHDHDTKTKYSAHIDHIIPHHHH